MSLMQQLLDRPSSLSPASRYTALNGAVYLALGTFLIVWPGAVQAVFMESAFVGREEGLMRVVGLTVVVIGWLYLFGGLSGAPQVAAASVVDRMVFVPLVLLPLAFAGVFPNLLVPFTILDMSLALGAWLILRRR